MKSAIFSLLPVKERSTIASVRIGRWLSNLLDIPIYDNDKILQEGSLDRLFIINGSTLYCHCLESLSQSIASASEVYWIQNDYTLPAPKAHSDAQSPFRKVFADRHLIPHHWTTCEQNANLTIKSRYVNWNSLGHSTTAPRAALVTARALYYGAYREGREEAFEAIYAAFAGLPLAISSTSLKFPPHLLIPPFRDNFYESLAEFGMGIYAQDKKSIAGKTSPATRFYEMLSVGLPMTFHPDCVKTLAHYGYNVSPYIMTKDTVGELIFNRKRIAETQQKWVQNFEGNLATFVKGIYNE
jgi:hypothetical protein